MKKKWLILSLIVLLSGCQKTEKSGEIVPSNPSEQPVQSEQSEISEEEIQSLKEEELEKHPSTEQGNVKNIGEEVSYLLQENTLVKVKVLQSEISKSRGQHPEFDFFLEEESADGENAAEGYSFVWVSICVGNPGEETLDLPLGDFRVRQGNYDQMQDVRSIETEGEDGKGHISLEPNQEKTAILGYILPDDWLQDMYYQVGEPYLVEKDGEFVFLEQDSYLLKVFE